MALALKLKKKAPASGADKPEIAGLGKEATEYRNLALEKDGIDGKMKVLKGKLVDGATGERAKLLKAGDAPSSVKIPTLDADGEPDGNRVLIVFGERFTALSDENIEPLKDAFGDDYSLAVEEKTEVKVAKGTKLDAIEKAIGKAAFKKLLASGLVAEVTTVVPRKGAAKTIAAWYSAGKREAADDLTELVETVGYAPSVRAK